MYVQSSVKLELSYKSFDSLGLDEYILVDITQLNDGSN